MASHPTPPASLPAHERLRQLDALRGFALLGILCANIQYWSGWLMMPPAQTAAFHDPRVVAMFRATERLLVEGKFYTLFSLLFGIGCALMMQRLQRDGQAWARIYRRRMASLLLVGAVHTLLIWDGDILLLYAVLGFALPWFAGCGDRNLLAWASALVFALPVAGGAVFAAMGWAPGKSVQDAALAWFTTLTATPLGGEVAWLQQASLGDYPKWTVTGTLYSLGLRLDGWRIPKVLGIMVLGLWVGRRIRAGLLEDRRLLWRVLGAGLAIGLPASAVYAMHPDAGQSHWASTVGTVPLALAYAAAFMLAWPRAGRWLGVFVAPGRMPLSNYLAQSVVNGLVFFGFGLGLIGRLSLLQTYAWVAVLFALQVAWSRWWLARHAQGPAESAWRRLTYPRGTA